MSFLLGLRTAKYSASDLGRAKAWYAEVLGFGPYFDEPFYVGFNVAGYELGITPDEPAPGDGHIAYWGVDDASAAYVRLLSLGATAHEALQDVGDGVLVGSVRDPFGNVFGMIQNPHFAAT
ncbi:MAG TPA: VOC family protein [Gemmatimonas sp.]|nr:VOC family protein [Gemmatimonas sp.]